MKLNDFTFERTNSEDIITLMFEGEDQYIALFDVKSVDGVHNGVAVLDAIPVLRLFCEPEWQISAVDLHYPSLEGGDKTYSMRISGACNLNGQTGHVTFEGLGGFENYL